MSGRERSLRRPRRIGLALAVLAGIAVAGAAGYALRALTTGGAATAATAVAAPPAPTVTTVDGRSVVTLAPAVQERSGLRTQTMKAQQYRLETPAYAQVLDLQPLIDLRSRHAAAVAQSVAAGASAQAARADEERSGTLYRDGQNVSLKVFEAAQASARALRASADAAALAVADLGGEMRTRFGDTLARWLLDDRSAAWQRLLRQQEVLLRVTRPAGAPGAAPPRIEIDIGDGRRVPAQFVARAAQGDPSAPGDVSLYRAAGPMAGGTRLDAYLPAPGPAGQAASGVVVPVAATLWYGGQPWAYVQTGGDRFARVPVPAGAPVDGGYFVSRGIAQGARVVVQGAQLLLSEELKPRAAGTACKDPECD